MGPRQRSAPPPGVDGVAATAAASISEPEEQRVRFAVPPYHSEQLLVPSAQQTRLLLQLPVQSYELHLKNAASAA